MHERLFPAGPQHRVHLRCSTRAEGDFHVDTPLAELTARRQALAAGEWTWLHQVHGATVIEVDTPGSGAGSSADGAVTDVAGAVLAVQTADCAPVVLCADGVVAVAHAGWRGLVAGVLAEAVAAVRRLGGEDITAILGPVIRPEHYEFGDRDLAVVEAAAGPTVRSRTRNGRPALDVAAAVRSQLVTSGVDHLEDLGFDTGDEEFYSHRVRRDRARQCVVAWLEPVGAGS